MNVSITNSYVANPAPFNKFGPLSKARRVMVDRDNQRAGVAARIKEARELAGMSQERLGELVGVSQEAVLKWERSGQIRHTNLTRAAEVLGVSSEWLLKGIDPASKRHKNALPQTHGGTTVDRTLIPSIRVLWDGTSGTLMDLGEPERMIVRPASVKSDGVLAYEVMSSGRLDHLNPGALICVVAGQHPDTGEWAVLRANGAIRAVKITGETTTKIKFVELFGGAIGEIPKADIEDLSKIDSIVP